MTTSKLSERRVSFFKAPIKNLVPSDELTLREVFALIKGDNYVQITEKLRRTIDVEFRREFKAQSFDYVIFSGTFYARNNAQLKEHSGLICIDFDHLEERRFDLLKHLIDDPFLSPVMAFTSPSGDGLKCVIPIDLSKESDHKTWFRAIRNYLHGSFQVEADPYCSHVSNACFLPHDPNAFLDPKLNELDAEDVAERFHFFDVRGWAELDISRREENRDEKGPYVAPGKGQDPDLEERVKYVVDELVKRGIDITIGYTNWLKLGFALANGLGEGGRSIFHRLSAGYPEYNYRACDAQYTACLRSKGLGVTIASFFWLAQQAGVELSGLTSARTATPPPYPNREKEPKNTVFTTKTSFWQSGGVAEVAEDSPAHPVQNTFSQHLSWEKLPAFFAPLKEIYQDAESLDKMLLCTLNLISGVLPESLYGMYDLRLFFPPFYTIVFGRPGSSKGDLAVCRNLLRPLKKEMQLAYDQAIYNYEHELAVWESASKESRGPAPKEPMLCSPFIAANSTASAFYRALHDNCGWGVVFEEEADTLTTMLSNKEYGDYSDLLRKTFQHETVLMQRVTDHLRIEIEKPRLSVFLTCTGSQLRLLLPPANVSNGLASRFLFYELPDEKLEFRDVFAQRIKPLDQIFTEMGEQLLFLIHALQNRRSHPIQFVLSTSQKKYFQTTFQSLLEEQFYMLGSGIKSFVLRIGPVAFRLQMIFTVLRRLSETIAHFPGDVENHLFDEHEQALVCSDEDFESVMTIINCLVSHTARVFSVIGVKDEDPFRDAAGQLSPEVARFYAALPDDKPFSTKEAKAIATSLGMAERSAERYISNLCNVQRLISRIKIGVYQKMTKAATSAC